MNSFYKPLMTAMAIALTTVACTKSIAPPSRTPVPLQAIQNQATLQLLSSVQVANANRTNANPKDMLDLQVAIADNSLIVATQSGVVQAFVAGQPAWRVQIGEPIVSGVAFDKASQTALVGTRFGKIVALDGETGTVRWQQSLSGTVLTPALVAGNRVLLSANDGVMYGLNLQSGAIIWQLSTQNPLMSMRGAAKPLRLDNDTVLFGTADGRIHALRHESGTPLWTRRVGSAITGQIGDVDGTPLVIGNYLYVTSYSGQLAGFDMATGQTMFTVRDFASLHPVVYYDGQLVGVDNDGVIVAFHALTGERLWQSTAIKFRKPSAPVNIGNYVAFGDYEGVVHLFDKNGNITARTQLPRKGRITSLQAHNNQLYAQTVDGQAAVWQVQ